MAVGPLVSAGRISCRYTASVTDLLLANPADGIPLPLYTGRQWQPYHHAQSAYDAQDYPSAR